MFKEDLILKPKCVGYITLPVGVININNDNNSDVNGLGLD